MKATTSLGQLSRTQVLGLYEGLGSELTYQDFLDSAPVTIARRNMDGARLAQTSLNTVLVGAEQPVVSAAGLSSLAHVTDVERLLAAVVTCLEDRDTARSRLGRLALAEPVEATQRVFGDLMGEADAVHGWVRLLEPDACQLCQWWARDGRIWPADHTMPTHKGCLCSPRPVVSDSVIAEVSRKGRNASGDRRAFGSLEQRRGVDPSQYSARAVGGRS